VFTGRVHGPCPRAENTGVKNENDTVFMGRVAYIVDQHGP